MMLSQADGFLRSSIFCPEHRMPDCSPLLNGCSRVNQAHAVLDAIVRERDEALRTLATIADADYRGNRSGESVTAFLHLRSVGLRT